MINEEEKTKKIDMEKEFDISREFFSFREDLGLYHPYEMHKIYSNLTYGYDGNKQYLPLLKEIKKYKDPHDAFLYINKFNEIERFRFSTIFNDFLDLYPEEMKNNASFSEKAYKHVRSNATEVSYREFLELREMCNDAFVPENEHAPEK